MYIRMKCGANDVICTDGYTSVNNLLYPAITHKSDVVITNTTKPGKVYINGYVYNRGRRYKTLLSLYYKHIN